VQRDAAPRALRQAVRDRKIRGNEANRVDHDKQSDQGGDEKFERHACRSRYSFAAILARQKGTGMEPDADR
jgi:hypothetical protein